MNRLLPNDRPLLDRSLWSALHSMQDAEARWDALRRTGATYHEIRDAVSYEFGIGGSACPGFWEDHKGGANPSFRYRADAGGHWRELHGAALLSQVRRLLEIEWPYVQRLSLDGMVEETFQTEAELNGYRESQGGLAMALPPSKPRPTDARQGALL